MATGDTEIGCLMLVSMKLRRGKDEEDDEEKDEVKDGVTPCHRSCC